MTFFLIDPLRRAATSGFAGASTKDGAQQLLHDLVPLSEHKR
jgi:hypothetical protein